jgi:hypothetical protein
MDPYRSSILCAGGILFVRDMYAFWDACRKFISRPEEYMKRLHDAVVLLSLPSTVGVTTVEGGIMLATVTRRLRDTDESDTAKATELKNWLAENLEVKTLGLAEVLYIYRFSSYFLRLDQFPRNENIRRR